MHVWSPFCNSSVVCWRTWSWPGSAGAQSILSGHCQVRYRVQDRHVSWVRDSASLVWQRCCGWLLKGVWCPASHGSPGSALQKPAPSCWSTVCTLGRCFISTLSLAAAPVRTCSSGSGQGTAGLRALLVPTKHTAGEKGKHPPWTGRDSPPPQASLGCHGGTHTSPNVCLPCLPPPILTPDQRPQPASECLHLVPRQLPGDRGTHLCLCSVSTPSLVPASLPWSSLLATSCTRFVRARGSRWWRAASNGIRRSQGHWCHPATCLLTPEKLESHSVEDALPGCFLQKPWKLLVPKFQIEGIKPFFPAVYPVPQWRPAAAGSPSSHAALISILLHFSFLQHAGQAPELLKETYSKPATKQSRTRPIQVTRTWCNFPTQTFKIGGTNIGHGATPRVSAQLPRGPCSTSCRPPRREVWGRQAVKVEAGAEEVAGDALHPTLVTSCSEPRQTQQRLLVPPGLAPGLSLKVLPTQERVVPALPRRLSWLQLSFPAPEQFLPQAGCPLPSRAQSQLCLFCSHHMVKCKRGQKKSSSLGFFFCSGQKTGPSTFPVSGSASSEFFSYCDLRRWRYVALYVHHGMRLSSGREDGHPDLVCGEQTHWEDETRLPAVTTCFSWEEIPAQQGFSTGHVSRTRPMPPSTTKAPPHPNQSPILPSKVQRVVSGLRCDLRAWRVGKGKKGIAEKQRGKCWRSGGVDAWYESQQAPATVQGFLPHGQLGFIVPQHFASWNHRPFDPSDLQPVHHPAESWHTKSLSG